MRELRAEIVDLIGVYDRRAETFRQFVNQHRDTDFEVEFRKVWGCHASTAASLRGALRKAG